MRLEHSWEIPKLDPLLRWMLPGIVAGGFLLARFFPFEEVPPLCPIRRLTDIPCIGCGGTRSWVDMAHLRFAEAFLQSPLGATLFLGAAAMMLYHLGRSANMLPALRLRASRSEAILMRIAAALLLLAHWLYLVLSGVAA